MNGQREQRTGALFCARVITPTAFLPPAERRLHGRGNGVLLARSRREAASSRRKDFGGARHRGLASLLRAALDTSCAAKLSTRVFFARLSDEIRTQVSTLGTLRFLFVLFLAAAAAALGAAAYLTATAADSNRFYQSFTNAANAAALALAERVGLVSEGGLIVASTAFNLVGVCDAKELTHHGTLSLLLFLPVVQACRTPVCQTSWTWRRPRLC